MEEILLRSLESLGVSIPPGVTSIQSLIPESLFAICSQSLSIVDRASSFPESLPESTADRFKVCKDMAAVFMELGYLGYISFHQFLYPSEDDLYKLVRFIVEKLSENGNGVTELKEGSVASIFECSRTKVEVLYHSETKNDGNLANEFHEKTLLAERQEDPLRVSWVNASETAESSHSAKTCFEVDDPQSKMIFNEKVALKDLNIEQSEQDPEFLKRVVEMSSNDQHPASFYVDQLTSQIVAKRSKLAELKSQWCASIKALEEKRKTLLDSMCAINPGMQEYQNLIEVDGQLRSVISEISQRVEERFKLSDDLEKMPIVAPRRSYIQRINEITKNSRKLDADIERILKETRELQMESNSTQESLYRTYAITSETISRDAKTIPVGQQAYKLLANIHENFKLIAEKILGTDRLKREFAEHEKKLASMASQSLDIDKLQADLDAIRKENEALQKHHI